MNLLQRVPATRFISFTKVVPKATAGFSTSYMRNKTVADSVKDQAKEVNRAVADKIVDGISMGQKMATKAKDIGGMSGKEAKGKAEDLKNHAKDTKDDIKKKI